VTSAPLEFVVVYPHSQATPLVKVSPYLTLTV
jgi:hypothetical protein